MRWLARGGRRLAVTLVGFALLGAGIVMLVTPGPGIVAILAGLALLATEYAWARRALDETKRRARETRDRARRRPRDTGEPPPGSPADR